MVFCRTRRIGRMLSGSASAKAINIMIGGEAGQGLVTVGDILTRTLVRAGYSIVVTQGYQSRIRGGHNTFTIRVGSEELQAPQEPIDILVAMNLETVHLHRHELSPRGVALVDDKWELEGDAFLAVPYGGLESGKFEGIVALGVVGSMLSLGGDLLSGALKEFLGKREDRVLQENIELFEKGFSWMSSRPGPRHELSAPKFTATRIRLNGNEAIALGALAGGMKWCSFYPMTPATSIAENLAVHARTMGVVVEQAEDEIAAINMAIGASFVGAPSMVATSGGGFALMTEAVSLAGMVETPVVIVVSQRPGPSTGLPTRTEQADLEFVLHSGHGEFPRAIFAPGTVEQCFHLTRKAFELAEAIHGPVFLLTDQFLADSYRSVQPFDLERLSPVRPCKVLVESDAPHQSYAITKSGVSPRLFPGLSSQCVAAYSSEQLVIADSDEHDEYGHLTEDLSIRKRMVEKRLRKMHEILDRALPPDFVGDESPDLLLLCWGSTRGAVWEASEMLRSQGLRVSNMHLSQVWPIVPETVLDHFEKARDVICIESNATGQMASLIRKETGFHISKKILRYDGLPLTPEFILRQIAKL
jgi:2-oxoglutarate/2-oxoacid ferredoxin oxidoreductase subunit alpha